MGKLYKSLSYKQFNKQTPLQHSVPIPSRISHINLSPSRFFPSFSTQNGKIQYLRLISKHGYTTNKRKLEHFIEIVRVSRKGWTEKGPPPF